MRLRDFQALSFDCYGTLIDWESGIAASLVPWARDASLAIGEEDLLVAYADHEAAVEAAHPTWPYPQVLAEAFRRTAASLDRTVNDDQLAAFAASVPQWPAFPDSAQALADLQRHYQLIILSNVDRESFAGSNARLGVQFDAILTAEDIGSYKPNPRNFQALLQHVAEHGQPTTDGRDDHGRGRACRVVRNQCEEQRHGEPRKDERAGGFDAGEEMSNFTRATQNPRTGVIEIADWLDDYFGHHRYGVRFEDGSVVPESEVTEAEKRNEDKLRQHHRRRD